MPVLSRHIPGMPNMEMSAQSWTQVGDATGPPRPAQVSWQFAPEMPRYQHAAPAPGGYETPPLSVPP